jgi:hypothetical protein
VSLEDTVPHRRGSFHEDWNDMLTRFAHRGTPAAIEDQIAETKAKRRKRSAFDFHDALFEKAHR